MFFKLLKKNKYHLYGILFAIFFVFVQYFSNDVYFFIKKIINYMFIQKEYKYGTEKPGILVDELNKKNILLQVENSSYREYKKIFDKFNNNKYKRISIIDVLYIKDKYMIAKTSSFLNIDDVIIDNDDFLVGIVVNVNKDIAKIILLTSSRVNIPVKILGKSINGVITGKNVVGFNNCDIEMYDIDNSKDINDGDIVLTSGKYGLTPVGLKIGKVYNRNGKFCVDNVKHYGDIFFSTNFNAQFS